MRTTGRLSPRARAALHHNPRDVWAVHALAHVFEMEGSQQEGVAFLSASARDWSASYDVTERAGRLAADIDLLVGEPVYFFNDWHAVMVFGLAGDHARIERVTNANRRQAAGTNRAMADRAGLALPEGFSAFAAGRPGRAIDLMIDIRARAR